MKHKYVSMAKQLGLDIWSERVPENNSIIHKVMNIKGEIIFMSSSIPDVEVFLQGYKKGKESKDE